MATYRNAAQALDFNGGAYVIAQNVQAFDPKGSTVAFWAKWRTPTFRDPCFIQNPGEPPYFNTSVDTAWVFAYNDRQDPEDGNRLTLSVPSNLTVWNSGASCKTSGSLADKQWHFVALVFTPRDAQHDRVDTYVDGVLGTSNDLYHDAGQFPTAGRNLGIGAEYDDGGDASRFVGALAEFQIWAGGLDAAKIQSLMNAQPVVANEPNLRVFIPLLKGQVQQSGKVNELVGRYCGSVQAYGLKV